MKLDKDGLVKNQFWFLLGFYLLIWVVALCILKFGASGAVAEKKKKFEDSKKDIETARSGKPKNKSFNEPWEKYGAVFANTKNDVWQKAWETQNPSGRPDMWLFDWNWFDSGTAKSIKPNMYITDKIERKDLNEYRGDLYKRQFLGLEKIVEQVELTPGVFQQVDWKEPPTTEEFWYAQEDLWVKKELLHIIKNVLDNVGRFHKVDISKEPMPKEFSEGGIKTWYRLRNVNWEIDAAIELNKDNTRELQISTLSTIKNIHAGKRTLSLAVPKTDKGQPFEIRQGTNKFRFTIEGEPQAPDSRPFAFLKTKPLKITGLNLQQPFELYQVFDWSTAPVKRIDRLELSYLSHRLSDKALKTHKDLPKPEAPATEDTSGGGGTGMPGMDMGAMMKGASRSGKFGDMGPGGMGGGAADTSGDRTPNGLRRDRYLQTTETSRALPVGIVLIVDQANIQDVLVALADSRLRIQTTQVSLQHIRGIRSSTPDPSQPSGTDQPATGRPGQPPIGMDREGKGMGGKRPNYGSGAPGTMSPPPGMGTGFPGPSGGFPKGGFTGGTGGMGQDEDDPNLVELSIYGIATLYERYPPKKPDETTDANKPPETSKP